FLVEATVLSLLGGIIGILIGLSLAGVASLTLSIPFTPSVAVILLAVGFSALIGMVFGFFPALRGARLDPIDALRHESCPARDRQSTRLHSSHAETSSPGFCLY